MGIRGLSSYIQNRSNKYMRDHELQNCNVVIDGSNLVHFSFLSCPRQNASFGGDYNHYYEHVKEIFRLMKSCKITPIVIFDGGLDIGDRKRRARLMRSKQKLVASIKVKPSNQHRMSVFPLLIKTICLTVLKELKIEVIQCEYEADIEIASMARGLKCPVISNDSDFYVMDVLVIPLSSMELGSHIKNDDGNAIKCKLFTMESFLKSIGYEDSSIFPLLGTLLGNDYADARLFENVFAQIHLPKSKTMTDQHCKLQGLLDWLRGQSVEDAIDQILKFIKKVNRNEVEIAIRTSLDAYNDENKNEMNCQTLKDKTIESLIEQGIPEWFSKLYTDGDIPCWVLEIMVSNRVPFHSQVESIHFKSTFSCCFDILKLITWTSSSNSQVRISTLWRKKSELVFKRVSVSSEYFSIDLPQLMTLSSLNQDEKRKLIFETILDQNIGRLSELPPKWQLAFAAIIHWTRHSVVDVRSYHVDGLIMSLINLSVVEPRVGRIRSLKRLENIIKSKKSDDPILEYLTVVKNTMRFYEIDPRMMSHDINYDRDLVHTLNEFQATYYYSLTLNQIFNTGLPCVSASTFYCGTFIYQAASLFKGHQDRLKLAERLYGRETSFFQHFKRYTELIYELAPSSLMDWVASGPNKPRKRPNKKKEKIKEQKEEEVINESSEESDIEEIIEVTENRFSLLNMVY